MYGQIVSNYFHPVHSYTNTLLSSAPLRIHLKELLLLLAMFPGSFPPIVA